jgi:hypothetical protein
MTWAQCLKRVFGMDIETCPACGGAVRIIGGPSQLRLTTALWLRRVRGQVLSGQKAVYTAYTSCRLR